MLDRGEGSKEETNVRVNAFARNVAGSVLVFRSGRTWCFERVVSSFKSPQWRTVDVPYRDVTMVTRVGLCC